jgi:tight adherence protein C
LLALSVTAGEGTAQALERVARLSRGELSAELDLCLARVRTGTSLADALQGLSHRTASPPITRFVDGLIIAIHRGTPLGEVLRAQAQDARESARQALIEEGGKREIAMMVPVVFLVLPVTVLFAVYPGIALLRFAV